LKRLATPVHEGLRLNQSPRPISDTKCALAVAVALKPTRTSQASGDGGSGIQAAIRINATTITNDRCGSKRVDDRKSDIVSGAIVSSARITKTNDGLKSGAHDGNLQTT
jgi:hypothetical protein